MSEVDLNENILDSICIAMPCSVEWDDMKGDNKVRLCGGCNKNVYNISAMSKQEAQELLSAPTLPCIQIARAESGDIITEEKRGSIHRFLNYGKTAVSAILSLIATFAPQCSAAADDKIKSFYWRGRPAVINQPKDQIKQSVAPQLPGVPIVVSKQQRLANLWPSSISGLGFSKEDLPLAISEKFSAEQIEAVGNKKINLGSTPPQLDEKAFELFYKARKLHLKASMYFVNKEMDKALQDCQESQKSYQLALEQIARGKHDAAFAAFVYQEQNKTNQIESQCRQCLNNGPQTK